MKASILLLMLVMLGASTSFSASKPLTLKQALKIALEKNLEVKIAQLEAEKGQTHIDSAESTFDTTAAATADWKDDRDKSTSTSLIGTKNITENFNASLTKKIITGTNLDLQFKNIYKETNATSSSLPTYWDPKLELNITQPILKNFFGINDRNNLKVGELKNILSRYRSEDQM
ncbi:MAG: TolC family protein, partial [Deltaproteobacteria bacterium]|nr:TolC family protein [Deltaproteobacteria bacterium]